MREIVTEDIVLHVAPSSDWSGGYWAEGTNIPLVAGGSNSGDGSRELPLETVQEAVDRLMSDYDFRGRFKATIQLATKSGGLCEYEGALISGRLFGQGGSIPPLAYQPPNEEVQYLTIGKYLPFTLRGDPANSMSAFFHWSEGMRKIPCISMSDEASLKLEGVVMDTFGFSQDIIDVFPGCFLDIGNCWFGHAGYPKRFVCINNARGMVMVTGRLSVAGNAASFIQNYQGTVLGNVDGGVPKIPIDVYNNPAFEAGFFMTDGGVTYKSKFQTNGTFQGQENVVTGSGDAR